MLDSQSLHVSHDLDASEEDSPGILENVSQFGLARCVLMVRLKSWVLETITEVDCLVHCVTSRRTRRRRDSPSDVQRVRSMEAGSARLPRDKVMTFPFAFS